MFTIWIDETPAMMADGYGEKEGLMTFSEQMLADQYLLGLASDGEVREMDIVDACIAAQQRGWQYLWTGDMQTGMMEFSEKQLPDHVDWQQYKDYRLSL